MSSLRTKFIAINTLLVLVITGVMAWRTISIIRNDKKVFFKDLTAQAVDLMKNDLEKTFQTLVNHAHLFHRVLETGKAGNTAYDATMTKIFLTLRVFGVRKGRRMGSMLHEWTI